MAFLPAILREIGGILSSGGQRRVAGKILRGAIGSAVTSFIHNVFGFLSDESTTALTIHAEEMVNAGQEQTFSPGGESIGLESIPENQVLYGDEPFGRRIQYDVEVTHGPSGSTIRLTIDSETPLSNDEIADLATEPAKTILGYEKFGIGEVSGDDISITEVSTIERAF